MLYSIFPSPGVNSLFYMLSNWLKPPIERQEYSRTHHEQPRERISRERERRMCESPFGTQPIYRGKNDSHLAIMHLIDPASIMFIVSPHITLVDI